MNSSRMVPARPTRVLMLSQALTQGGSERQLATTAMNLDPVRFSPHVAVLRPGGFRADELSRAGIPVTNLAVSSFKKGAFGHIRRFRQFLKHHQFDVVHCFDVPTSIFAVPIARLAGVPAVLASTRGHRELLPAWQWKAMRVIDRLAHGALVNCRFLAEHLTREEGVPASKIHLCYNGLDTSRFHPTGIRAALPFPPGSIVIGCVCVLRAEKNLGVLMEGFAGIAPSWPQARLVLVGDGPERPMLERMARDRGILDRVHFEPAVADTAPWFRSLDIFVLPSISEAFSNSLMEAMACGATPVASAIGGNTELVTADRGLVFDARDPAHLASQLHTLLGDPQLRRSLGRTASQWVTDSLASAKMACVMGEIYDKLLRR